jgi:hypothetical protein
MFMNYNFLKIITTLLLITICSCGPVIVIHGKDGISYYKDESLTQDINCHERYTKEGKPRSCCCDGIFDIKILDRIHRCGH